MDEPRGPRLGLDDAMILAAALAAGVALAREAAEHLRLLHASVPPGHAFTAARHWFGVAYPAILPVTLVVPCLAMRRSYPSFGPCFRRPGIAAATAASVVLVVYALHEFPRYLMGALPMVHDTWGEGSQVVGYGVLSSWITARLGGLSAGPRGVLDWIGSILGALWVAALPWAIVHQAIVLWPAVASWYRFWFGL